MFGNLKVQSFILTEVSDCGLLNVFTFLFLFLMLLCFLFLCVRVCVSLYVCACIFGNPMCLG